MQETFVRAIEAAPRFDSSRRLEPWLVTILLNLARRGSRASPTEPLRQGQMDDPEARAIEVGEWETFELLREAIAGLSKPNRDVVSLRLQRDLSLREIAQRLGRCQGTVRSQYQRGIECLRAKLGHPSTEYPNRESLFDNR